MGVEDTGENRRLIIALALGLVAGTASLFLPTTDAFKNKEESAATKIEETPTRQQPKIQVHHGLDYACAEIRENPNKDYNNLPPAPKPKKDYNPQEAVLPSLPRIASCGDEKDTYSRPPTMNHNPRNLDSRTTAYYRRMEMGR